MKIDIKALNLTLTDSFREYISLKLNSLSKIIDEKKWPAEPEARIEIRRDTHHRKGDVFSASLELFINGKILRADAVGENARMSVDLVKDKIKKEIEKYKDKLYKNK